MSASPSLPTRARKLLGHIRRSFGIDTFDVFARPIKEEDASFEAPPGYRFAWATADDILGCDELHTELNERERELGAKRIAFGHSAVVAFHGETIVFSMWVNPRNVNIPGHLKRELKGDQSFIYKAFSSPEHRGKKLYQAGMRFVLADMAAKGQKELIGYAHVKKKASRAGLDRLGFYSKGTFEFVFAPGIERVKVSRELASNFPVVVPRSGVLDAN